MLRKFDHDFRAPSIVADAVGAAAPDGIVCLTGVSDCGHVLFPSTSIVARARAPRATDGSVKV
jgi:hypothetical protein